MRGKTKAKSPKIKKAPEISDDLADAWADIRPKPIKTKSAKAEDLPPFVLTEHERWVVHLILEAADEEMFHSKAQEAVAEALYDRLDKRPDVLRPWKDLGTPVLKITPKQAKKIIKSFNRKSLDDDFMNLLNNV